MSAHSSTVKSARRRFVPLAIATGVIGAALLATSMSGTLSGFAASITNSNNTAATGALVMQEQSSDATPITCLSTDGGSISTNTATCSTINKFGGSTTMVPGQTVTTAISIKNVGSVAASTFTLTPGATCAQAANGSLNGTAADLCAKLNVVIKSGTATVFTGTAATLAGAVAGSGANAIAMPAAPAAGVSVPFTIAVTLALAAGNTYQGLSASLPLTWTFAS
ncbi:hypothetical protein [Lacisediminihabitans changchengi]|uniref:Uncharacterized protein n=1 Tax=Lacisediminihabitans changchengi TaxID=2787634 RepID=A0A934VXW6_9MICO|nr:hypothetical protein [Lacisediminihabitans changchengi]MBK4347372.1 hypothetical protein [Lacisediminihabitans changchengi]